MEILEAANGKEAMEKIAKYPVTCIITDIRMPLMDGLKLISECKKIREDILVVFLSAYPDFEYAQQAIRMGAVDYVVKPVNSAIVKNILDKLEQLEKKHGIYHTFSELEDETECFEIEKVMGMVREYIKEHYNEDILNAAGVELPPSNAEEAWTWEKFVEICQKLTIDADGNNALSPDFDPTAITQYGVTVPTGDINGLTPVIHSNGGRYFDENGNYCLKQPEAIDAIQKVADLINVYHVAPSPVVTKSLPSTAVSLQTGKSAMAIDGQWICLDLGATEGLNFNIGVLPNLGESVTIIQGGLICMFEGSEHPEEAWELWKWLYNSESVLELHASGLWSPTLKSWYTDEELLAKWTDNAAHPSGYIGSFVDQAFENGFTGPGLYVKHHSEVNALVLPALDEVWLGNKTAEEAIQSVDAQVQEIMNKE